MGNRIGDVGKPHCFNGFQVAINMLKAAFWSPAEPTWDFKVCAAPRSNAHFAGGGWLPTDRCPLGDHPDPGRFPPTYPPTNPPEDHKRICSVIDSAKAAYIDDVGCL